MNKKKIIKIVCLILALIILFAFCNYQNKHLVTTEYEYYCSKIPDEFNGLRICQISDFHNATFGKDNVDLISAIDDANPDIVLFTGDFIYSYYPKIDITIAFASEIASKYPTYYVTGNHELRLSSEKQEELYSGLENCGVVILSDESAEIERNGASIRLIGIDDNSLYNDMLSDVMSPYQDDEFNILMAHEPQYLEQCSESNADLVFSGHAHGGQFILPVIGPVVAPDQGIFPKLTSGLNTSGDTTMVISRGIGSSIIPVRLFNYPEIVIVTLYSE